jgi:hypothetical protein
MSDSINSAMLRSISDHNSRVPDISDNIPFKNNSDGQLIDGGSGMTGKVGGEFLRTLQSAASASNLSGDVGVVFNQIITQDSLDFSAFIDRYMPSIHGSTGIPEIFNIKSDQGALSHLSFLKTSNIPEGPTGFMGRQQGG